MKDMHCRDTGESCSFVARGRTDAEVEHEAVAHLRHAHGIHVTPEIEKSVQSLIHDESSDAHRKSLERPADHVSNP